MTPRAIELAARALKWDREHPVLFKSPALYASRDKWPTPGPYMGDGYWLRARTPEDAIVAECHVLLWSLRGYTPESWVDVLVPLVDSIPALDWRLRFEDREWVLAHNTDLRGRRARRPPQK